MSNEAGDGRKPPPDFRFVVNQSRQSSTGDARTTRKTPFKEFNELKEALRQKIFHPLPRDGRPLYVVYGTAVSYGSTWIRSFEKSIGPHEQGWWL